MNRWSPPSGAFVAPQVRSLRKGNSDHIAIAVDENPGGTSRIEEEDDKGNSALNHLYWFLELSAMPYDSFYLILVSHFLLQSMVSNPSLHPRLSQDLLGH